MNRESSTKILSEACGGTFVLGLHDLSCPLGFTPHMENAPLETVLLFHPIPCYHLKPTTTVWTQNWNIGTNSKKTIPWSLQKRMMSFGMPMRFGPNQEFSKLCATRHAHIGWSIWIFACSLGTLRTEMFWRELCNCKGTYRNGYTSLDKMSVHIYSPKVDPPCLNKWL